jgi:hypothetical protein
MIRKSKTRSSRFGAEALSSAVVIAFLVCLPAGGSSKEDWANFVRIAAYGLKSDNADQIVAQATRDNVFGIEVDNDIPGRYESFVNPQEKLRAIRAVAAKAHSAGNYAFVYIAGTECITANAANTAHSMFKEHPDWIQRKITGEPALFGGGTAFWIRKGDEDVWVSPYAPGWRKIYMERVRQIAATGIDGIYVDIPYWMTHFEGWENTWASFDDYTVEAFRKQTGLNAKTDLKLGDFSDPNFRKWVDFRIQTFTEFMQEIAKNGKSVNPKIKVIPEIYPGIEEAAVRVGADVYSLYPVVDAIAHEYEFGETGHMAASRSPLDWFCYQVGMHSFRAFAQGKPTWILNYSWDGEKNVDPREAMRNLAMSELMAGANVWDAPGHSMAGSNDYPTRREIFTWIKAHQDTFYTSRTTISPVGVYFSPKTRDYFADDFIAGYRGVLILLMQQHQEFQVVTPRTLSQFGGPVLVLPDVRVLGEEEKSALQQYVGSGKRLIVTGEDATQLGPADNIVHLNGRPGSDYFKALEHDFDSAVPSQERDFLDRLEAPSQIHVLAGPAVATSIARVAGKAHIFFANFAGLRAGANPVQTPQRGVQVSFAGDSGTHGIFLPFLGSETPVNGTKVDGEVRFTLPMIEKGAVFWLDQNTETKNARARDAHSPHAALIARSQQ